MTDTSKQCNITNNSGRDIAVALALPADETPSANAVEAANGQWEILKTAAGGTVIENGSSATVTLDHNYKEAPDGDGYVPGYDIIISEREWLYPLATLPVQQQTGNGATGYAAQTVAADKLAVMNKAVDFYQTIAVYPNSKLATDYTAAIEAAKETAVEKADGTAARAAAISEAIYEGMTAFFNGTQDYKDVTLADVVAVDGYYTAFPTVWAQYKDSLIYYLYGSDGETAGFTGALSLQKEGALDAAKSNGGYTCLFLPAVNNAGGSTVDVDTGKAVALTYTNGLFVDDAKSATPAIALRGSFILKRAFTLVPDDKSVMAIVTGTVNNRTCIGFDAPQKSSEPEEKNVTATATASSPVEKYWDTLIHPATQKDLIITIMTFVCAALLIPAMAFAVYRIYKAVTGKPKQKPATKGDVEDIINKKREAIDETDPIWFGPGKEAIPPREFKSIALAEEAELNYLYARGLFGAFQYQVDAIEELLRYSSMLSKTAIGNLQNALDYISNYEDKLGENAGNPENRTVIEKMLTEGYKQFQIHKGHIEAAYGKVKKEMVEDAIETMDESIKTSSAMFDNITTVESQEWADREDVSPEAAKFIRQFEPEV